MKKRTRAEKRLGFDVCGFARNSREERFLWVTCLQWLTQKNQKDTREMQILLKFFC